MTEGSTRRRTYHIKWGTIPSLPHVDEDLGIDGPSLGRHDCRRQLYVPVLRLTFSGENQKRMRFLFTCGMSTCVEALAFKVWRDHITTMIQTACFVWGCVVWGRDNSNILHEIQAKVAHFEDELTTLKEVTTILELALWKLRLNKNLLLQEEATHCQKKVKTDESSVIRKQCRIICGADVVIGHVLPFLISVVDHVWS